MNNVDLIGRLTGKPELRAIESGAKVCKFNLAVRRDNDNTDFVNCMVWNNQAENLCKYCNKGSLIGLSGRLQTGSYEKNGTKIYTTDVVANRITFLNSKPQTEEIEQSGFEDMGTSFKSDEVILTDDDLPF